MLTDADKSYIKDCKQKIQELNFQKSQLQSLLAKCVNDIKYYKERMAEIRKNVPLNEDFSDINSLDIIMHAMNKDGKLKLHTGYDKILHPDSKKKLETLVLTNFITGLVKYNENKKNESSNRKPVRDTKRQKPDSIS